MLALIWTRDKALAACKQTVTAMLQRLSAQNSHRISQTSWQLAYCPPIQTVSESGITLLFSGRLDNRPALHQAYLQSGAANTDAGLVLYLWRQQESAGLQRLQGVFTIVVIESDPHRITLYRAPLGGPPLFYQHSSQQLIAASEPYALLAHPQVTGEPDPVWLAQHFALLKPVDNRTAFQSIQRLLPGECLICTADTVKLAREPLKFNLPHLRYRHERDYVEHFRALLHQAVQRQLANSGEPVAIMLSGGLDSGPLAALAQQKLAAQGKTLLAVSWSLPHYPEADETDYIKACAEFIDCPLQLIPGEAFWPLGNLNTWPVNPNSPVANAFRRLKLAVYRHAAQAGCTVILNGNAGDYLYPGVHYLLLDCWRDQRFGLLLRELYGRGRKTGFHKLWRDSALRRLGAYLLRWRSRPAPPPVWLSQATAKLITDLPPPWPPEAAQHPRPDQFLNNLGLISLDGLHEEAFFARRCGIERRDPYHDPDLIGFMLAAPAYLSHRQGQTKWIMREAMQGLLPEPFRLKSRTGLLNTFFDAGYAREFKSLQQILSARRATWAEYVDRQWLMNALEKSSPSEMEKLLVWYCAAYELWQRAISGDAPELLEWPRH